MSHIVNPECFYRLQIICFFGAILFCKIVFLLIYFLICNIERISYQYFKRKQFRYKANNQRSNKPIMSSHWEEFFATHLPPSDFEDNRTLLKEVCGCFSSPLMAVTRKSEHNFEISILVL